MDFSKYYFLGHIVDNLHDVKDAIAEAALAEADGYPVPFMMSVEDVHTVLGKLI